MKVVGGQDNKNFHYVVGSRNGSAMLFYCDSYGDVEMALGNFDLSPIVVSRFVRKLGDLSAAFKYIVRFEDKRVSGGTQGFMINETLVDPKIMATFKASIVSTYNQWPGRALTLCP